MSGSLNQDKNLNIGSDADEKSYDETIDIKTAIKDLQTDIGAFVYLGHLSVDFYLGP